MKLYRMHLKTEAADRRKLIDWCLRPETRRPRGGGARLAIGWSRLQREGGAPLSLNGMIDQWVHSRGVKSAQTLLNFRAIEVGDLVWTRDADGVYYLCRVLKGPEGYCDRELDIGAILEVDCRKVGTSVPGAIVNHFCPPLTVQGIVNGPGVDKLIEYSKQLYNALSGEERYRIEFKPGQDICQFLHPLDLEELVIDYLQIRYDYYLSKNSVAKMDTTIKVECELFPREPEYRRPAVLQVKSGEGALCCADYADYVRGGRDVFLFSANGEYRGSAPGVICIERREIEEFAVEYRDVLPGSIQHWIDFCRQWGGMAKNPRRGRR